MYGLHWSPFGNAVRSNAHHILVSRNDYNCAYTDRTASCCSGLQLPLLYTGRRSMSLSRAGRRIWFTFHFPNYCQIGGMIVIDSTRTKQMHLNDCSAALPKLLQGNTTSRFDVLPVWSVRAPRYTVRGRASIKHSIISISDHPVHCLFRYQSLNKKIKTWHFSISRKKILFAKWCRNVWYHTYIMIQYLYHDTIPISLYNTYIMHSGIGRCVHCLFLFRFQNFNKKQKH